MYAAHRLRLPERRVLSALTERGKESLSDGDLSDGGRKSNTSRHPVEHGAAMGRKTSSALQLISFRPNSK